MKTENEFKEEVRKEVVRIVKALSEMDTKPDYLLFIGDYEEDNWDFRTQEIFLTSDKIIPVIYTRDLSFLQVDGNECPYLPCFNEPVLDIDLQVSIFRKNY